MTRPEITGRKMCTRPRRKAYDPEQANAEDDAEEDKRIGDEESEASSISTFCRRHGISVATYYNLRMAGQAPTEAIVRGRHLITREAAEAWRRQRERVAAAEATT
jgi:hypothetical protein